MLAPSNDTFWNVADREREEVNHLERDIATINAQLDTCRKVAALRHAPGFQDFLDALKRMHAVEREKLIGDTRLTDQGLREARGGVRRLEAVLSLLTRSQMDEQLAAQLKERQNVLAEALRRRPIPKEATT